MSDLISAACTEDSDLYEVVCLALYNMYQPHSRAVMSSNSCSRRIPSDGSSRISMPGPTDLEVRPLGNIW